jgi:hypothetical protein
MSKYLSCYRCGYFDKDYDEFVELIEGDVICFSCYTEDDNLTEDDIYEEDL